MNVVLDAINSFILICAIQISDTNTINIIKILNLYFFLIELLLIMSEYFKMILPKFMVTFLLKTFH